ncbi:MAG: SURF1 family protein [Dehalococcoidia bacterium]|nr:SURF1 family protein [Dehalococcoidia bacterium]
MPLRNVALVALIGAALAVLTGLGVWQLQRNDWKQDLVAHSHERTDAPPLDIADTTGTDAEAMDYRRVTLRGEWLWEDRMFLANRVRSPSRGEEIVAPVRPEQGGPAVLVNLGWIPDGARDDVVRGLEEGAGLGVPVGLARDYSSLDGHQIPSGSWSAMSPHDMADALGYPVTDWVLLVGEERDAPGSPSEPLPVQGWQRFTNTTPHVEYALTWFGIATVLLVAAVARFVVAPRRARQRNEADPQAGLETGRAEDVPEA